MSRPGITAFVLTLVMFLLRLGAASAQEERTAWSVRIVSPFPFEPLGAEEMLVSIDVSALPFPNTLILTINGREVASNLFYVLESLLKRESLEIQRPLLKNSLTQWSVS